MTAFIVSPLGCKLFSDILSFPQDINKKDIMSHMWRI
jgi:hypothetical protein